MYEVRKIQTKKVDPIKTELILSEEFIYNTSASLLQTIKYKEYLELKVDPFHGEINTYIIIKATRYSLIKSGFESIVLSFNRSKNSLIYKLLIDYEEFWDD